MNDNLLSEQSKAIKEAVGEEAFQELIDAFGGNAIYIPKRKFVEWRTDAKPQAIQMLRSGTSPKEVAKVCKISSPTIYRLAQELKKQPDNISINESFLSEESQDIKKVVGEKTFLKLVDAFGGSSIHIPMKINPFEQKEKAVKMLESGFSPKEVSRVCKISKSTIYRLAQKLKNK